MKQHTLIILLFILIGPSCSNENKGEEKLIPKEKMALILTDFMLLEATYNMQLVRLEDKDERMLEYSNEILNHHNVSRETFDFSYEYYMNHSEEFEATFELVFEELSKLETESLKFQQRALENDSTLVSDSLSKN